jgi:hypothetical protein
MSIETEKQRLFELVAEGMVVYTVVRKNTEQSGWVSAFLIVNGGLVDITRSLSIISGRKLNHNVKHRHEMYIGRPGFDWSLAVAEIVERATGKKVTGKFV